MAVPGKFRRARFCEGELALCPWLRSFLSFNGFKFHVVPDVH